MEGINVPSQFDELHTACVPALLILLFCCFSASPKRYLRALSQQYTQYTLVP
jgi:hypothetical protein